MRALRVRCVPKAKYNPKWRERGRDFTIARERLSTPSEISAILNKSLAFEVESAKASRIGEEFCVRDVPVCRKFAFAANARIKGHPTYLWSTAEFAGAPLECVELVFLELRTGISALATAQKGEKKVRTRKSLFGRNGSGRFVLWCIVGGRGRNSSAVAVVENLAQQEVGRRRSRGVRECDYPFSSPILQLSECEYCMFGVYVHFVVLCC